MELELKEKEQLAASEKDKREKLEEMIKQMEQRLVVGGNGLPEKDKNQAKAYREMQLKLKKQKKKEKHLMEDKIKKDEEMLLAEKNYKSLQEEVDDTRKVVKKLRIKYRVALNEISDLQKEHELHREDLLDTIREQEKDLNFYYGVAIMMFNEDEMTKIRAKSIYDNEGKNWKIPPFLVKSKKVKFPQLKSAQAMSVFQNEKESREIEFYDDTTQRVNNGAQSRESKNTRLSADISKKNMSPVKINAPAQEYKDFRNDNRAYLNPSVDHQSPVLAYNDRKGKYLSDGGGNYNAGFYNNGGGPYSLAVAAAYADPKKQKNQKALVHLQPLQSNPATGIVPVIIEDIKKSIQQNEKPKHPILDASGFIPEGAKISKRLAPISSAGQSHKIGGSVKNLPGNGGVEVSFKATFVFDKNQKNQSLMNSPIITDSREIQDEERESPAIYLPSHPNQEEDYDDLFN